MVNIKDINHYLQEIVDYRLVNVIKSVIEKRKTFKECFLYY